MYDKTYISVKNHLKAFSCDVFTVGIKSLSSGKMELRKWKTAQVLSSIKWLRQQNLNNNDIFIRPALQQGFIFLDDINVTTVKTMQEDGFSPAIVIQSSPLNYHCWVRIAQYHGTEEMPSHIATAAAKYLCERYQGDKASADFKHFGRLAGFTNQKPEHFNGLHHPFVKLHQRNGNLAPKGTELLSHLLSTIEEAAPKPPVSTGSNTDVDQANVIYKREWAALEAIYGSDFNESIADWRILKTLKQLGFTRETAYNASLAVSVNINTRKKGHIEDYLNRTLDKIYGNEHG